MRREKSEIESSLDTIWQKYSDNRKTIVLMSAFRNEKENKENIDNNKYWASQIKKAGFGYHILNGYFLKNNNTSCETRDYESCIFAVTDEKHSKRLISLCRKVADKFEQNYIIVKEAKGGTFFLNKNNNRENINIAQISYDLGKYFAQLRNKGESEIFVFEKTINEKSWIGKWKDSLTLI